MLKMQQHGMATAFVSINAECRLRIKVAQKKNRTARRGINGLFGDSKEFGGKALFAQHWNRLPYDQLR